MKPGYKQTEVGVIPKDWQSVPLHNFVALQRGYDLTEVQRQPGEIPVMGSAGLNGFHAVAKVDGPGLVLGRSGASYGQAHFCPTAFWPHNTALYVTNFQGNVPRFAYYYLSHLDFSRYNSGGAQQSLNRNFIARIPIPLPPFPEQKAIAEALGDVDALIESLEQLIAKKKQIKQGAMQELLTGKRRLPGFSGEWEEKKLGDVCEITTGRKDVNQGNPNGIFPFFTCSRVHTFSDSYSFDTEAILIAGNGDVGNLNYFAGKFEAYQRTYVLREFSVPVSYLWHHLSAFLAPALGLDKVGSSIPYIKRENLIGFTYLSPRLAAESSAIATVLSEMDSEISAVEQKLSKTRAVKQGMMQELLTGRIRLV